MQQIEGTTEAHDRALELDAENVFAYFGKAWEMKGRALTLPPYAVEGKCRLEGHAGGRCHSPLRLARNKGLAR